MTGTVQLRGEGGSVFTYDLPLPKDIEKRLMKGYLTQVSDVAAPLDEAKRPAKNAAKAAWVGWAVRVHGLTPDDADAMTLADLKELPDAPEAVEEPGEDSDGAAADDADGSHEPDADQAGSEPGDGDGGE
ncbi:hypothetical protein AB0B28_08160 [Glycomyces sp. NPDC046736]|uniref:hypothetical protein n=1 Tax=Glycomyces sp. NPDC046736 TaxID=3155615 RepID=UPI0033CA300C